MSRWIPDYEYANRLLVDVVGTIAPRNAKLVDLGAGTGRVTRLLLEQLPEAEAILVDVSPNMLAEAKRQLSTLPQKCAFLVHDIFDSTQSFESESIDCVVSAFAISHGQGEDVYEGLYSRIRRWLRPGGIFVNYDHVLGATLPITSLNALGWAQLMKQTQSHEAVREAVVSTYQEDSPLPLESHMRLLKQAGFDKCDVIYKRDIFAIYCAIK
jgi:tRNA (cmo5U34)-methyltransferase